MCFSAKIAHLKVEAGAVNEHETAGSLKHGAGTKNPADPLMSYL